MAAVDGDSQGTMALCTMPHLIQGPGITQNTTIVILGITGLAHMKEKRFSGTTITGLDSMHTMDSVAGTVLDIDSGTTTAMVPIITTSDSVTQSLLKLQSTPPTMKNIAWSTLPPLTTLQVQSASRTISRLASGCMDF